MLRKGNSVTNIHGIGNNTEAANNRTTTTNSSSSTLGQSAGSVTSSSPFHYLHHQQRASKPHRSQSSGASGGSRENLAGKPQPHFHHQRFHPSPPPSGGLDAGPTPTPTTPPRRGGNGHCQSTGDISRVNTPFSNKCSPARHHQHCWGCSCSGSATPSKGIDNHNININHLTLSSSASTASPRHTSSPLETAQLFSRDRLNDSHPRLATRANSSPPPHHNRISRKIIPTTGRATPNNKLWLVGKKEEEDDEEGEVCYYPIQTEEEEDDEEGGSRPSAAAVPPAIRQRRSRAIVTSNSGGVIGSGSVLSPSSHGYRVLSPSPVVITGTVPGQQSQGHYLQGPGVGGTTPFNNAGAIHIHPTSAAATPILSASAISNSSAVVANPPELLLPMDFIQVLIHQHAKTIVALQDLQREVSTLKDFRTSLLHSLPATGATPPAPSSNGLSEAVWTTSGGGAVGSSAPAGTVVTTTTNTATSSSSSGAGAGSSGGSAPKIPHPDSGFSTETKSTNQKSDAEQSDDELYSLLSLIQCKVQESIIRNDYLLSSHQGRSGTGQAGGSSAGGRSRRRSDTSTNKPKERLGKLDGVLGNCDKVEFRKDFISRDVIRGVLGAEKTELQRQLFFALVKIENLKSTSKEQKTIDSRVHALYQENEQLRYKLKEMEIELEGTKATLRILQKNSYSPPAILLPGDSKRLSSPSPSSTVLPEAISSHPHHNPHGHSTTSSTPVGHLHHQPYRQRLPPPPVIPPAPMWETDSLDEGAGGEDYANIPGATSPSAGGGSSSPHAAAVGSSPSAIHQHHHSSSVSTATRQRLIQKLSDIESVNNSTSSKQASASVSSSHNNNSSTIRLLPSNNYSNVSSSQHQQHQHHPSVKKSPAPRPPVIMEHATTAVNSGSQGSPPSSSGSGSNNNNNNNTISSSGKKSASPVGNKSMSSIKSNNSSIPIAVSRLKAGGGGGGGNSGGSSPHSSGPPHNPPPNNNNNANKAPAGKVKGGGGRGEGGSGSGAAENGGIGNLWANWFRS